MAAGTGGEPETLHDLLEPLRASVDAAELRALEQRIAAAIERAAAGGDEAIADFLADSPVPFVVRGGW